jgi:peptidoglycan/LPS O-acetylase OafA/YrhL
MKDSSTPRFPVIDAFKAIASQLIVLHHLAAYGPISTAVQQAAPALIDWLYDYARMAVQVFFVIGGYHAARSMFSSTGSMPRLTTKLINRYLRLVVPFFFALVLAILCAFVARQ